MNDKIIDKIKNCGFDDIRLLSEGGHGQVFFVRRNRAAYVLKSYFSNSEIEAKHEEEISRKLHGEGKGNPYGFKSEVISDSDGTFFLLNHTDEGKTIEEIKENSKEKLSIHEATEIMIKSCEAIMALHDQGIIHFDIKPSNLYLVDKVSYVKSIDYGSAVEIKKVSKEPQKENYEEIYNKIISSSGYCSTEGYMTKRLQEFCKKRELFSQINTTDEQKISLIEDEKKLGLQEDIYSLLCTYWFLLTNLNNWGVWNQDFCYLTTEEKIRLTLEKEDIPTYLISPLVELFMTIDAPCKDAEAEISFSSVFELITVFKKIKEIEAEKERHPAVILKKSLKHFSKDCNTTIKEELLCNILKKSSSSESEELSVSLAEYILNNLKNHNNIQLVSEGGAGKSFQLLFSCKKLFDVSATKKIIPLYIPMNRYNGESHFIKDYIIAEYGWGKQNGQEDENNRNLLKDSIENHDYTFYLIIDSINESSAYPDVAYSEIKEISKWNNTKIIVASRNASELLSSFDQIGLQKLTNAYLKINIPDFKGLNQSLRGLLGLPFYFERYLKIDYADKGQITSAAELIETYHNWMLEKIKEKSVSPEKYSSFLEKLITKFLPEFSYKQLFSLHPLNFNDNDFVSGWNEFKTKNYVPFDRNEHLHILEELGIIKMFGDDKHAFCHQNTYTYFVAKYISYMIGEKQSEGDSLLVDITDNYILTMVGELLGEHRFANKESLEEQKKSSLEEKLDKYRGIFDDSTIARIIAKYVDIMKLCRKCICTADFSDLDLSDTYIMGTDWSNSNFENSVFSKFSFKDNNLGDPCFAYYDEENHAVIISDLESRVLVYNDYFRLCEILSLETEGKMKDIKISIYENRIEITKEYTIFSPYKSEEKTEKIIHYLSSQQNHSNKKMIEWTSEWGVPIVDKEIFVDEIVPFEAEIYYRKNSLWKLNRTSDDLRSDVFFLHKDNIIRRGPIFYSHIVERSEVYISKGCFTFDNGRVFPGNIYVVHKLDERVYDTQSKRCLMYNRHKLCKLGTDTYMQGRFVRKKDLLGRILYSENEKQFLVNAPIDVPFAVSNFKNNSILLYNSKEIAIYSFDEEKFHNITHHFNSIITLKYIPQNDSIYVLSETGDELLLSVWNYETGERKNHSIGFSWDYGILPHSILDIDPCIFYEEVDDTIDIKEDKVYILFENIFYIFFIDKEWNCKIELKNLGIYGASFKVNGSEVIIYDNYNNTYTCISINVPDDTTFLMDTFGTTDYKGDLKYDSLDVYQKRIHNGVVEVFVDNRSCFKVNREWTIRYLENTDIRGCNFDGAVIKTEGGEEKPIPEEILFNT